MLYIFTSTSLTEYGHYSFDFIKVAEAKKLIEREKEFVSTIYKEGTAILFSTLVGIDIPTRWGFRGVNTHDRVLRPGDKAIVFKVKKTKLIKQAEDGVSFTAEQIKEACFPLGLIVCYKKRINIYI